MQASSWDKIANEVNFNLEIDIDQFLNRVPLNGNILDFGCGYGRISSLLNEPGFPRSHAGAWERSQSFSE